MTILAILAGSLLLYFALATPTALFICKGIDLADHLESPAVRVGGEDPAHSGARHLRVVP